MISGKFLQGGAGANFLQPAAGAGRVQPAAPAPYYQPAASTRAYQNAGSANMPIIRTPAPAAAPVRNNSTRMPVATVMPVPKIASVSDLMKVNNPTLVEGKSYNYVQAANSAYDYYKAGSLAGGAFGCAGGAFLLGPGGCVVIGGIGSQVGGVGAGFYGFFEGLRETENADNFNWGVDQVHNPWR